MSRYEYYEELKELARQQRLEHELTTPRVLRSDLRRIYKQHGIRLDLWPPKGAMSNGVIKTLRGAFFCDEYGVSVMISRTLPDAPAIFTMAHEFKHFLVDRASGAIMCGETNQNERIEIGAEVFAAEFLYPDQDFREDLLQMGVKPGECTPEDLVRLKHERQATLSYKGMSKKAEFLKFASLEVFEGVKWQSLEEKIYGIPIYKQVQQYRKKLVDTA
ncbi:MAG: ImmA/IrrE family metallo-endopeptidase [Leptolyngbyaceae cyanobacterium bins.302]|nr:ImmA/IrrE family metallo-endopeptidase [Leptolyngbyaceae cyanobacterium bins.302]